MSCNHLYDCSRCSSVLEECGDAVESAKKERDTAREKLMLAVQFAQANCTPGDQEIQEWIWACGFMVDKRGKAVPVR